jgi:putative transposase
VLSASRSGFYAWRRRAGSPAPKQQQRAHRDTLVKQLFDNQKGRSGAPRLALDLAEAGHACDRKTVADSMKRQNLRAKAAKKFKATTQSDHDLPVFENELKQDFYADEPNQKWVGDITYLWTSEGWVYLAVVIDLYSRMVVGWAMSDRMKTSLVCDALMMALWRRGNPREVIVHTDRGSQYCSKRYRSLLEHHALIGSMSGTGNCYDNAVAESFFHTLKVEAIHGIDFSTRQSVIQEVFEYIEVYYNRNRRHSTNGYTSPHAFELTKRVA